MTIESPAGDPSPTGLFWKPFTHTWHLPSPHCATLWYDCCELCFLISHTLCSYVNASLFIYLFNQRFNCGSTAYLQSSPSDWGRCYSSVCWVSCNHRSLLFLCIRTHRPSNHSAFTLELPRLLSPVIHIHVLIFQDDINILVYPLFVYLKPDSGIFHKSHDIFR